MQQKYISSAKDKDSLHRNLLAPVIKWAVANKDAEVNLWYDSVHTSVEAIYETKKELDILTSKQNINNIYLRNIRDIPIVSINKDAFSDQTPIYYRVDILKAIIIVFSIENENKDAAIFTDLEVGNRRPNKDRMGKDELFDSATMEKLEKYSLIHNDIENQFLQLKNNELMIKSIKHAIINANLMRAEFILNSQESSNYWGKLETFIFPSIKEDVYNYYNLIKNSHVLVRPDILFQGNKDEEWIEYKPEIHGYLAFGHIRPRACFNSWFIKISDNFILRSKVSNFHKGNGDKISDEASRSVDVRIGGHHEADYSDFIQSVPADGSNTYKVYFIN